MTDAAIPSAFDLTGRIALITGSSRGIGRAIAHGLASAGATVVLHGRDPERLEQTRAEFAADFDAPRGQAGSVHEGQQYGPRVHAVAFDITDAAAVASGIAHVEATVGPIQVLVNNAGIQHRVPLLDLAVEDWNRVLDTNLTSAFLVGREVARGMVARGRGKIINVASVQTDLARETIAPYTVSKGGIRNLTRAMTAEWARHDIQVNAIAPGYIHTEMTQKLVDDEQFNSWIIGRTPAKRWGTTDDIVGPALWLASDASNFVNGQTIFIDGGMTVTV
ncbi:SDR family oxidoreductase [Marisediminicola senii]|uniref:SDR family oxidoreductase n=1 Tax=Marisediminicola senii TaxID=2711233 RepID=UPI0013EBD30D|nr:SDR family oxidoreductase [Marisediminicola senii]